MSLLLPSPSARGRLDRLIKELEKLPTERTAAVRILWIADDSSSSAEDLAGVVSSDPALTTRIMRMANSAYYGLSGRVRSCAFAVTVLGFTAVRSLAAASAAGALDSTESLPNFWLHGATVATAAAEAAPRVGAPHAEAFSLGLLHDLGRFLFHRIDADGYAALAAAEGEGDALLQAERRQYACTHPDAAAQVLAAWRFPEDFTESLGRHHQDPASVKAPLARALLAGEALAELAMAAAVSDSDDGADVPAVDPELVALHLPALRLARIDADGALPLITRIRRSGEELAVSMRSDSA